MTQTYETVLDFLKNGNWKFVEHERGFYLVFSGRNGQFHCSLRVEGTLVTFHVNVGLKTPPAARGAMAELVARINGGLILGNFEFDPDDGDLRYKNSINVEGGVLSEDMCRHLLFAALCTADRYLPAIHRVALGVSTPAQAVELIENPKTKARKAGKVPTPAQRGVIERLAEPSNN